MEAPEIAALRQFCTPDCVNHADPASEKRGLDALRLYHEGFAKSFADFDDLKINIEQQIAENDRVMTEMLTTAVHRPTKRHVSLATIRIDRLVQGKIA